MTYEECEELVLAYRDLIVLEWRMNPDKDKTTLKNAVETIGSFIASMMAGR